MFQDNKFRCFMSLVETGSFTKTANMLSLSQQAVSKNIRSLEYELGIVLFQRTPRPVELTPEGKRFYKLFSKLSDQYSVGIAYIRKSAGYTTDTLCREK